MSPEQIFTRPGGDFLGQLAGFSKHLDAVMPMRRQHRHELPRQIRQLSHLLTDERDELKRDYLSDPAALSAYMRYFLPWNIYRLGVLFAGLALDPGGDTPEAEATIIDLGSGPLTAAIALWMARPHLRHRKLHFICVDRAQKPMRLGLDALKSLASKHGLEPWRVTLVKGSLDERLREKADLVIMANAVNEVLERSEGALLEEADSLAGHLSSMLTPTGQLMIVEPGIRPSAHLLSALRRGLLHRGLKPLAPCPHTSACPMSGRGYTAWCHFNFDAEAAPAWLKRQSEDARLTKDNVSLSFLHFSTKGRKLEAAPGKSLVRAVSGAFELPASGKEGESPYSRYGQYACSERGLTLLSLPHKHLVPMPGTLLEAAWPESPEKDAKSGALVLPLKHVSGGDAPAPVAASAQPGGAAPERPKRKPPRLPSERPMERVTKHKPKAKPMTRQDATSPSAQDGKPPRLPADRLPSDRLPSERPLKRGPKPKAHAKPAEIKAADETYAEDLFADEQVQDAARMAARRNVKKKPGKPAVKVVSKPKGGKASGKSGAKPSRAARKAGKQQAKK
ncbi:MAG: hypothetical protein KKF77_08600 [Proteobacteria bacterium]|nr:hypothetical protein [Pseudomonadota bacterium]